jgi:hypothetical protein
MLPRESLIWFHLFQEESHYLLSLIAPLIYWMNRRYNNNGEKVGKVGTPS